MASHNYGRSPDHFVEIPDQDRPGQTKRPDAGYPVQLRDAQTSASLGETATLGYGYVKFGVESPAVQVSTDNFTTDNYKVMYSDEVLAAVVRYVLATQSTEVDLATALAEYAPLDSPALTGIVTVNGDKVPDNPVGANLPGVILRFPPLEDPDAEPIVDIVPSEKTLQLPATPPTTTEVVTIEPDGSQGSARLDGLGGGSTTTQSGAPSVQTTARAILAGASGSRLGDVFGVHPNPPTVTLVAGTTSSITGAVRVPFKRASASVIDTVTDPHFYYLGARPGQVTVHTTERGYANLLTGGGSQNRRDYWRPVCEFSGQVMEWFVQPTTGTFRYRLWVDGMPTAVDMTALTATTAGVALTAGSNYLLRVDFGSAPAPRVVELEVNDPRIGGCWIGPTDTITRYVPRRRLWCGFGDSHTAAGANGVNIGDSWLTTACKPLNMLPVNMAIGGSGFFAAGGTGLTAPNFRSRLDPDVVPVAPDMVTFWGGYNDGAAVAAGTVTSTQIRDEAAACFTQLRTALPSAVLVSVGPWQQTQNIAASTKTIDDALRAAADAVGIPHISLVDPRGFLRTGGAPAWAAGTTYGIGDVVTQANVAWEARSGHTAAAAFTTDQPTRWRALSFNTGTGKAGATTGDGNADINVGADGIHATAQGHKNVAYFLAQEHQRVLRELAA